MADLELRHVSKTYPGGVTAIRGIDCGVSDGELLVMLGPSGCGKSTLLRMVAGLESVTGGEIRIGDTVVNRLEPKDRDIAMVFQNYALYPHMSVFGNMAYGLKIAGRPKSEIKERVDVAARMLGLGDMLDRRPRQLSGGQRQRVAMGRAIVRQPRVFLFDEPLSNLDAKLRTQMRIEIKKLQRRLGVTSLYVTHDQVEAMTLADRIMVMNGGIAEQIGTPGEIYDRPASVFVGGFIGAPPMNFLRARLGNDSRSVIVDGGQALPITGACDGLEPGRPVLLGVRPEKISLQPDGLPAGIRTTVDIVEDLGADSIIHARTPTTGETLLVRVFGACRVSEGDTVTLGLDIAGLHLFDPESGRRVEQP